MSYAIETKKRKFDRILESLTDNAASQSKTSLSSNNSLPVTSDALSASTDASKRRRITPVSSTTPLSSHYLPSSRVAFLERLETFRYVTKWHAPSTAPINAAAWAKRGWTCVETDTVSCGSCKERVTVNLDMEENQRAIQQAENGASANTDTITDSIDMVAEIYEALLKRYQDMIITSHAENCPWRRRGCDRSIQRIEGLLNTSTAMSSLTARQESISERSDEIPTALELPAQVNVIVGKEELQQLEIDSTIFKDRDGLILAICGWQRKDIDVIECRNCFRSLGLWLYRGEQRLMENLDPIDSHLEYCPWRSADTQDTEVPVRLKPSDQSLTKAKVPGWVLVYMATMKRNAKTNGNVSHSSTPIASMNSDDTELGNASPEQREKKLKDLMRRIREIKKPFNVRSLLRKKTKV